MNVIGVLTKVEFGFKLGERVLKLTTTTEQQAALRVKYDAFIELVQGGLMKMIGVFGWTKKLIFKKEGDDEQVVAVSMTKLEE